MRVTSTAAILHSTSIKSDEASMVAVATTEDDDSVTEVDEVNRAPTPPAERRESSGMIRKTSAVLSRDSVSTRGPQSLAQLPVEGTAKAKGIELDLDQSWQRALLHELEKNDGQVNVKPKEDKQRPELVLLRHSESQDYACEIDQDDVTIGTNASSTVPVKPQSIHRTSLYLKEGLFDDESSLGRMDGLNRCQSAPNSQTQFEPEDNRDETPYGETTPKNSNYRVREDVFEEKVSEGSVKPIPDQLPRNRNRAKQQPLPIHRARAIGDELQQPFLEIELSGESDSNPLPDSSCFCWGYNVLDFWLPPHTPQYRRKRHPRTLSPAKLDYILEEVFEVNHKEQKSDVSPHRADPTGSYNEHGYDGMRV